MPKNSRSIIAQNNSIDIDHGNDVPGYKIIALLAELINHALHHPRANSFTRMLSCDDDCNHFSLLFCLKYQIWDFGAHESLP